MQLTVFIRNMRSVFFTLAFPIMMIVLFASGSSGQANIPAQQGVDVTMASWTTWACAATRS
jgi:ABC transporter family protein